MTSKPLVGDGEIAYINTSVKEDPQVMGDDHQESCAGCGTPTWVNPASFAEAERRGKPVIVCMACANASPATGGE